METGFHPAVGRHGDELKKDKVCKHGVAFDIYHGHLREASEGRSVAATP